MDFSFTVEELMNHAVIEQHTVHALGGEKGYLAAEIELVKKNGGAVTQWASEEMPAIFSDSADKLIILLRQKAGTVPFELTLKDFRKVDYPGTSRAASFESDVVLRDIKEKIAIEKTIHMNRPLNYKRYRVFQSSYIQDPSGEASIFTIAKNPGIDIIYGGSIIMFIGIFTTFFVPPFSSIKND